MFRIILGILLAVGVFSMQSKINPALDSEWQLFKQTYKKVYSPSQEIVRRLIWENNLGIIKKHNAEFEAGNSTYTLGVNAYADMTSQEFGQQMNGYRTDLRKPAKNVFKPQNHVGELPTTVDWREKGYVTPVKDQGPCGSCWAFSTTGSLEGQHFKKTGKLVSLSEQNLVDCSWSYGNQGCAGGLMELAMDYIVANDGVDTEASYPYTALDDGPCLFNRASVGATAVRYDKIRSGSEKDLQIAVASVGPISVAIDALTDAFQFYKSGVLDDTVCSSVFLNHAVLAVGYGVYEGKDYWLVKNSWGTSWGMDGYVMMSRNNNNQCGIATDAGFPTV